MSISSRAKECFAHAIAVIEKLTRAVAKVRLKESDLMLLERIAGMIEKANAPKL
ncbi:hypothetical protein HU755_21015 [Pseudomonas sp. SWRI111]|uniref:hypothetical protein n=1 Tax=Pseudomonas sp. SWRI111 TaxID=2745507 RepID=UPI0016486034|nr:hypothetical protein [Pseudomonas sp. SWRI111]MBC3209290.1 hypothetical protein [Pseudomonas sp. SWRI111]